MASEQASAIPDAESLAVLALTQNATGDTASARQTLDRLLELDPRNPTALEHRALFSLQEKAWARAAEASQRALEINPELPRAWNYLGVARSGLGDVEGALQAWEKALTLGPGDFDVAYNLAVTAVRDGQIERGERALRTFLESSPPGHPARDQARAMLRELELRS